MYFQPSTWHIPNLFLRDASSIPPHPSIRDNQKTKFTTEWSVTFGNRHFQVSTQAADTAFSAKRIPQALEGVRKFLQPHRSLHHKRVRVLYQAEFQFENVPKIIKRNFQTKFPCWVTFLENDSTSAPKSSPLHWTTSSCHVIFVWI